MAEAGATTHAGGRARYASDPARSRGRLVAEPESANRNPFQRDRDRIIHSAAFRRLKHKTQVFVYHEGDHYRTRLTHSLEVSQIARSVARSLGLDEDLAEALSLAHDLGHPPFGHAGEDALAAAMEPFGGFDHNGQTLRVLTHLEARYADFDGLNLTWETLEGIVKHNGPLTRQGPDRLPWAVAEYNGRYDLELHTWPSAEAQVASLADDVAYHSHDLDDGLRAGLFELGDLRPLPGIGAIIDELDRRYPGLDAARLIHETKRRLIDAMVTDILAEARERLAAAHARSADDIRALGRSVVEFSRGMAEVNQALKEFLHGSMYRHYRVNRMTSKARRVVRDLFDLFMAEPGCLPAEWQQRSHGADEGGRARAICDYIAGMTDRYALDEHRRLYDLYEENR
jgi:dGTPase